MVLTLYCYGVCYGVKCNTWNACFTPPLSAIFSPKVCSPLSCEGEKKAGETGCMWTLWSTQMKVTIMIVREKVTSIKDLDPVIVYCCLSRSNFDEYANFILNSATQKHNLKLNASLSIEQEKIVSCVWDTFMWPRLVLGLRQISCYVTNCHVYNNTPSKNGLLDLNMISTKSTKVKSIRIIIKIKR